jgi:hypothetical protein
MLKLKKAYFWEVHQSTGVKGDVSSSDINTCISESDMYCSGGGICSVEGDIMAQVAQSIKLQVSG